MLRLDYAFSQAAMVATWDARDDELDEVCKEHLNLGKNNRNWKDFKCCVYTPEHETYAPMVEVSVETFALL